MDSVWISSKLTVTGLLLLRSCENVSNVIRSLANLIFSHSSTRDCFIAGLQLRFFSSWEWRSELYSSSKKWRPLGWHDCPACSGGQFEVKSAGFWSLRVNWETKTTNGGVYSYCCCCFCCCCCYSCCCSAAFVAAICDVFVFVAVVVTVVAAVVVVCDIQEKTNKLIDGSRCPQSTDRSTSHEEKNASQQTKNLWEGHERDGKVIWVTLRLSGVWDLT